MVPGRTARKKKSAAYFRNNNANNSQEDGLGGNSIKYHGHTNEFSSLVLQTLTRSYICDSLKLEMRGNLKFPMPDPQVNGAYAGPPFVD